jgi:hypothetical protein
VIDQTNSNAAKSLVAIDIAKEWTVVLTQSDGGERRTFKVANRAADHDRLVEFMKSLPGPVRVGLEPTGDIIVRSLTGSFAKASMLFQCRQ